MRRPSLSKRERRVCASTIGILVTVGIAVVGPNALNASAAQEGSAAAPTSVAPPNLLLVTLDTTRADRFSAWGRGDGLAARIDRLASQGVVFGNCVAPMGTTKPSHASMFTGLYPRSHGVLSNALGLSPAIQTAAGILSAAGYETGAFVSLRSLLGRGGVAQGFKHQSAGPKHVRQGMATSTDAIRWLTRFTAGRSAESRRRVVGDSAWPRPFFAWVHYFDAHSPYNATSWTDTRLDNYEGIYGRSVSVSRFGMGYWIGDPTDTYAIRTLYDGAVLSVDGYVDKLLSFMETSQLLENTVVIVVADHGQALGEHGHPGHGYLWESILRVPLVIWDGRGGERAYIEERVGLVDLAPTIVELGGVEVPAGLNGRSLVPALRGETLRPRPYFANVPLQLERVVSQSDGSPANARVTGGTKQTVGQLRELKYESAVYEGSHKLLVGPEDRALFDLSQDSGENSPLSLQDHASIYNHLDALRINFLKSEQPAPSAVRVSDDVAEQMRALGYID